MISAPKQVAQDQARHSDGKFGSQVLNESAEVKLDAPPASDTCKKCGDNDDDLNPESSMCDFCHADAHCSECGERYDGDGDGYDGKCGDCADATDHEYDMDNDTVSVFVHAGNPFQIDHRGNENYSLYDEGTNEHVADFQYSGDPEDHDELEAEAVKAIDEIKDAVMNGIEAMKAEAPANRPAMDLSNFSEEESALPRALYDAGLDGTLEPYNGDYPVEDGAVRYWVEGLPRDIFVGTTADGNTVIGAEDGPDERNNIRLELPTKTVNPVLINLAIRSVVEQSKHLEPLNEEDW